MKKNIIYLFFHALAALLCLSSCALEEPIDTPQNSDGYIEFVARPVSYDKLNVGTKATSAEIAAWENNIYTAFFMVFDNSGNRIIYRDLSPSNGHLTSIPSQTLQADKRYTNAKVCYLVNVSSDFAEDLTTYALLTSTPISIEYAPSSSTGCIGVPLLKKTSTDAGSPAIPMFGYAENCNLSAVTSGYQTNPISLERLFAKVDVKLNVQNGITFNLTNYTVNNIPTNVMLLPPAQGQPTAYATSGVFLTSENTMTSYNLIDATTGDVTTGFYFYVPEHMQGGAIEKDNVNNTVESNKPLLVSGTNMKPTYVEINGALSTDTAEYTGKYSIYLGKNETNNFDLERNTYYKNTVTIKGLTAENRVELLGGDQYTNLVDGEAANCYIITAPGKYILPAYMGATKSLAGADMCYGKPRVVWTELDNDAIVFTYPDKNDSKIVFEVSSERGKFKAGNALIAIVDDKNTPSVTDDDEILWSWHLWFCPDDPSGNLQSYTVADVTYQMMNRNLGATNSIGIDLTSLGGSNNALFWRDGLFYQWGRKDPIRSGSYTSSTSNPALYSSTVKNPSIFYTNWDATDAGWAIEKSSNDPCPPGYKVPSISVWSKSSDDIIRALNMNSSYFVYDILSNKTFPYSGKINSDGEFISGDKGTGVESGTYDILNLTPASFPLTTETFSSKPSYTPTQYRNIDYNHYDQDKLGNLWGCDEKFLTYGYETKGATITGYDYRYGEWKSRFVMTEWKTKYYASYPVNPRNGWVENVSQADSHLPEDHYNKLIESYILPLLNIGNIGSYFTDEKTYDKPTADKKSYGLQVRCIKDE